MDKASMLHVPVHPGKAMSIAEMSTPMLFRWHHFSAHHEDDVDIRNDLYSIVGIWWHRTPVLFMKTTSIPARFSTPTSLSGGTALQSFMKSDVDIRKDLYSNVVIWWHRTPVLHEERRQ